MDYEYISWNHFYRLCGVLYRKLDASRFRPNLIIAITRGGYPAARVLADYFDLMDLVSLKIEHYRGPERLPETRIPYPLPVSLEGRRVLLVDDVSDSGDTFDAALAHLRERGQPEALRTAVLHHKISARYQPDYYAQKVIKWRWISYPWALVEDMTTIARGLTPRPQSAEQLLKQLPIPFINNIPQRVLEQVVPIVLQRMT